MSYHQKKKFIRRQTCQNCRRKFPAIRHSDFCSEGCRLLWVREIKAAMQVGYAAVRRLR